MPELKTKRRFGCLRLLLICLLLPIGLMAFWVFVNFPRPAKAGKPLVQVSPETTVIVEPLDENGDPDYIEYFNRRFSQGITPDNNAAVLVLQTIGPTIYGQPVHDEYYRRLGTTPLSVDGNYLIDVDEWMRASPPNEEKFSSSQWEELLYEQYSFAMDNPWTAEQLPELAAWLKQSRPVLELFRQATLRPRYYAPLIDDSKTPTLLGVDLFLTQQLRRFTRMLSIAAMNHLAENRVDEAFADALAIRRTARLADQAPSLVEALWALKIEEIGVAAEFKIAQSGKPTRQQLLEYLAFSRQLSPLAKISDRVDNYERFVVLDAIIKMARDKSIRDALDARNDSPWIDSIVYPAADWKFTCAPMKMHHPV